MYVDLFFGFRDFAPKPTLASWLPPDLVMVWFPEPSLIKADVTIE